MLKISSYRNLFLIFALFLMTSVIFKGDPAKHIGSLVSDIKFGISFAGMDTSILDNKVKRFVDDYIQNNKACLFKIKQKSHSPFDLMDSIFNRYNLPIQLKYIAVIESELKTTAVSQMGAVGPWQLMPETAHLLGLRVSRNCDERKSYPRSTQAAAKYLKDLHVEFGDWLLVMAAYNGGEGPVNTAIRLSDSRNFWILQQYLPRETREYVKKFMATYYYFEG
jgi:membrane-bound lytic murein transglycosylase D